MITLAFDTATGVATSALLDGPRLVGERTGTAATVLVGIDELLAAAALEPSDLDRLVVGTGPGSFTSTRIGLAIARGLGLGLDVPVAGVSTLEALAQGHEGAYPVIDARRGEVFVAGPSALSPDDLDLEPGTLCVGSGAVRYRATLERKGAVVPPDEGDVHVPHARLHVALAREFGSADAVQPIYVRAPDAKALTA